MAPSASAGPWGDGWTPISLSIILVPAIKQLGRLGVSARTSKGSSACNGKTSWLDISPAMGRGPLDDRRVDRAVRGAPTAHRAGSALPGAWQSADPSLRVADRS